MTVSGRDNSRENSDGASDLGVEEATHEKTAALLEAVLRDVEITFDYPSGSFVSIGAKRRLRLEIERWHGHYPPGPRSERSGAKRFRIGRLEIILDSFRDTFGMGGIHLRWWSK